MSERNLKQSTQLSQNEEKPSATSAQAWLHIKIRCMKSFYEHRLHAASERRGIAKQPSTRSPLQMLPLNSPFAFFQLHFGQTTSSTQTECCNVTHFGGLGEEKAVEEATINQGKLQVKFLRCVPPASELLGATSSHHVLLTQVLPTDLRNNQTCPFPKQKTFPRQVSVSKNRRGDEGAHTDAPQLGQVWALHRWLSPSSLLARSLPWFWPMQMASR